MENVEIKHRKHKFDLIKALINHGYDIEEVFEIVDNCYTFDCARQQLIDIAKDNKKQHIYVPGLPVLIAKYDYDLLCEELELKRILVSVGYDFTIPMHKIRTILGDYLCKEGLYIGIPVGYDI